MRLRHGFAGVIVHRAMLFGSLAAFITAVYVAIVVGIGAAIGSSDQPNLGLSILATALVAVAFRPVREVAQRLANRLVYGPRATPYEVLSRFSENVAGTYATEDVLPRMARILAEGTGARRSEVWLRVGSELRRAAAWPEDDAAHQVRVVPLEDGELPPLGGSSRAIAIRHQGELLGAIAVEREAPEASAPTEERLLADLASQAGLVLRNVRLTAELQERLDEISRQAEELRASRQRIVAAQDAERRRLERNIHDGSQQHLVALAVKIRLSRSMAVKDPGRAMEMVRELQEEAAEALETLRDLARGIYPPLLAESGLAAALNAQARRSPVPVSVVDRTARRYPHQVESAVYFCCLEAMQNVAKYASASGVVVTLEEVDGRFEFSVADDGRGFDRAAARRGLGLQNMADRLEALGGTLAVESAPGSGTTVAGRVPIDGTEVAQPALAAAQASASRSGPNDDFGM